MRRRDFITLLGGAAAAWPLAARAQRAALPVIGFLDVRSADAMSSRLRAFRLGLKDTGYVEGENVSFSYHFAENQTDRLPELAADLVQRQVAVIAATAGNAAFAAKAATTMIPVVFLVGEDPVKLGLVASLARPSGNLTGINVFTAELVAKRLGLLRDLMPRATRVAVMVNPADVTTTKSTLAEAQAAARAISMQIQVLNANSSRDIDATFETIEREKPDALFVSSSPFFIGRHVQLVQLAAYHRLPAAYSLREFAEIGGLMSYGPDIGDAWRQAGVYTGRILKGTKPADLPVVQPTKFELVINHPTARMLGLTVPDKLLAIADEVIE
jgi:putative ABC transport system substrate-binding protein